MIEKTKSLFENINELIRVSFWPIIVLLIFLSYRSEINDIFKLIPIQLQKSSKISVGSFSFEIENAAKEYGNQELGGIIKNLSENGIKKLLTLGSGNRHSIMLRRRTTDNSIDITTYTTPYDLNTLIELEKNGLINTDEPIENLLSFLKSLKYQEKARYRNKEGSTTEHPNDEFNEKYIEISISSLDLTSEQENRIDHFGVELSDTGEKAFDIIVHVIAEQINNK